MKKLMRIQKSTRLSNAHKRALALVIISTVINLCYPLFPNCNAYKIIAVLISSASVAVVAEVSLWGEG